MIEGAPSTLTAGTSIQLSALSSDGATAVAWRASGGSIDSDGLFTAPRQPPAGGSVLLTALAPGGARDEREVAIVPAAIPQPAPAAPLPPVWDRLSSGLSMPQAMLVGRTLVMTTTVSVAGRLSLGARLHGRPLGRCAAKTPAERSFTCRVRLARGLRHAAIEIDASLWSAHQVLRQTRRAAPIAPMEMPLATPLGGTGLTARRARSSAGLRCAAVARRASAPEHWRRAFAMS